MLSHQLAGVGVKRKSRRYLAAFVIVLFVLSVAVYSRARRATSSDSASSANISSTSIDEANSVLARWELQVSDKVSLSADPLSLCHSLQTMRPCAHRAHANELSTPSVLHKWSLAQSFTALCAAGVCCFDVDVFATSDGHLLVGRPSDAEVSLTHANALNQHITTFSLSQLQQLGLPQHAFPLFKDALQAFRTAAEQYPRDSASPLLMVELKGSAMSQNSLAYIAQQASVTRLSHQLAIWFPDSITPASHSDALHQYLHRINAGILKLRGHLDHHQAQAPVTGSPNRAIHRSSNAGHQIDTSSIGVVRPEDIALYDAFGPSLKLPNSSLAAMAATGKLRVAWLATNEEDIVQAAHYGVRDIITDFPIRLRQIIAEMLHIHCADVSTTGRTFA